MRGKKIGIGLCILGMLFGCTKHEPKLTVKLFYLDSCGGCQELHQNHFLSSPNRLFQTNLIGSFRN